MGWYYTVGSYAARIIRASWVLQRISYFLLIRPALHFARRSLKDELAARWR